VGLEQNVYDHRRICRNVRVDPITSFLYWNMQYHTEHHMFPTVPFHALRKLHAKIKDQLPAEYPSVWAAYREIIPTVLRQQRDHNYHVSPKIPDAYPSPEWAQSTASSTATEAAQTTTESKGILEEGTSVWVPVPGAAALPVNDVMEFKHEGQPYSIYHLDDGYYALSNKCSHAGAKLSRGLVIDGEIECPAHNGRFNIRTGEATLSPACENMKTFPVRVENDEILLGLPTVQAEGVAK
jgi:nitrite reductase/ring-hydroxylating ferredoxin subunit